MGYTVCRSVFDIYLVFLSSTPVYVVYELYM